MNLARCFQAVLEGREHGAILEWHEARQSCQHRPSNDVADATSMRVIVLRGAIPFAVPEHIGPWMEKQLAELAGVGYPAGLPLDDFTTIAARYMNEINAAHPFVDGNGRTQRFWLRMLADNAGFDLTLEEADRERWNEASRLSVVASDHGAMAALLKDRLKPRDDIPRPKAKKRTRNRKS